MLKKGEKWGEGRAGEDIIGGQVVQNGGGEYI